MKFEKLNDGGSKKRIFIYGFMLCAALVIVINLFFTRAKYKLVESRKLASGTINYTLVDFELAEIKFKANGSEDYTDVSTIEDNYELNQDMSYCTEKYTNEGDSFEDVKNESLTINFDKENKTISVSPYSKKGTKCHLYFDEYNPAKDTLANLGISGDSKDSVDKFTGPSCSNCTVKENGLYEAEDDYGTSYYYRGTVSNNWVVFGTDKTNSQYIWWRIIRINGNGTIRLIYAGTSSSNKTAPNATGAETMITPRTPTGGASYPKAVKFNTNSNDNKYVGYMYGGEDGQASTSYEAAHKSETKSTILDEIVNWYQNNTNLGSLATKIDVDTGFCGDRTYTETNHGNSYPGTGNLGYGSTATVYGAEKVWQANSTSWKTDEQTATYKCTTPTRDLYTGPSANANGTKGSNGKTITGNNKLPVPVGLITMDEVIHAGGFAGQSNKGYWLYTNQYYWTMSPSFTNSSGYARVFSAQYDGSLNYSGVSDNVLGVRPVINLKADITFTFDNTKPAGTTTNPYVVVTT